MTTKKIKKYKTVRGIAGRREIKFRAIVNGHWITWEVPNGIPLHNGDVLQEKTISQFIGLHDKNGKEIYEGDVVQTEWAARDGKKPLIVMFQPPEFIMKENNRQKAWYTFNLSHPQYQFEKIIGNIYENPELFIV